MTDEPVSLQEFLEQPHDPLEGWGPWVLDVETLTLSAEGYSVDLARCLTPAATLDWIMQVAGKAWATPVVLAGLVHALDTVLDPQANLCPDEQPRALTKEQVHQLAQGVLNANADFHARKPGAAGSG